jgi:hypothetical protein
MRVVLVQSRKCIQRNVSTTVHTYVLQQASNHDLSWDVNNFISDTRLTCMATIIQARDRRQINKQMAGRYKFDWPSSSWKVVALTQFNNKEKEGSERHLAVIRSRPCPRHHPSRSWTCRRSSYHQNQTIAINKGAKQNSIKIAQHQSIKSYSIRSEITVVT